jgi:hypothetical protein
MSCEIALIGPVFFVRWHTAEVTDLDKILAELERARREAGRKLVYVAVIPSGAGVPGSAVRDAMARRMPRVTELTEVIYFVIEGSGFQNGIMRSVLTGILLLTKGAHAPLIVHASVEEALGDAGKRYGVDAHTVLAEARTKGLLAAA